MADRERERDSGMSKILSSVEAEVITSAPTSAPVTGSAISTGPGAYAPPRKHERTQDGMQRIAGAADNLQQIQNDMKRVLQELELRYKAILDEIKRAVG